MTRWGNSWLGPANPINQELAKICRTLKIEQPGRSFYGLRRSFFTQGDNRSGNTVAVKYMMGWIDTGMSEHYRCDFSNRRLLDVAKCVRRWLYGIKAKKRKSGEDQSAKQ